MPELYCLFPLNRVTVHPRQIGTVLAFTVQSQLVGQKSQSGVQLGHEVVWYARQAPLLLCGSEAGRLEQGDLPSAPCCSTTPLDFTLEFLTNFSQVDYRS